MSLQVRENEGKIWIPLVFVIVLSLSHCGYGVYHKVRRGETLDDIARKYNVRKEDILEANRRDPTSKEDIREGDYIYIPLDKRIESKTKAIVPDETTQRRTSDDIYGLKKVSPHKGEGEKKGVEYKVAVPSWTSDFQDDTTRASSDVQRVKLEVKAQSQVTSANERKEFRTDGFSAGMIFPVEGGEIISHFGVRNGRPHNGIDIKAPEGTPVKAVQDGVVIFSGFLKGYGNTVIIKHEGDYFTVYAHNKYNTVREGDFVRKGNIIGYVGMTGNAGTPHLHFEVRKRTQPINPLMFLEERTPKAENKKNRKQNQSRF